MIKSMTGFGRCEVTDGERKFTVEMKSDEPSNIWMPISVCRKSSIFLKPQFGHI